MPMEKLIELYNVGSHSEKSEESGADSVDEDDLPEPSPESKIFDDEDGDNDHVHSMTLAQLAKHGINNLNDGMLRKKQRVENIYNNNGQVQQQSHQNPTTNNMNINQQHPPTSFPTISPHINFHILSSYI